MTSALADQWATYLTTNPAGKIALLSVSVPAAFDRGNAVLPINFALNFTTPIWRAYFDCSPFVPVRGAYPLNVDKSY